MNMIQDLVEKERKKLKKEPVTEIDKTDSEVKIEKRKEINKGVQRFIEDFKKTSFDPEKATDQQITKFLAKNKDSFKATYGLYFCEYAIPLLNNIFPEKHEMITVEKIELKPLKNFLALVEKRCNIKIWIASRYRRFISCSLREVNILGTYIRYEFL